MLGIMPTQWADIYLTVGKIPYNEVQRKHPQSWHTGKPLKLGTMTAQIALAAPNRVTK